MSATPVSATLSMPPNVELDLSRNPEAKTWQPDTLETLREWADEFLCKQVLGKDVISVETWQDDAIVRQAHLHTWTLVYHTLMQSRAPGFQSCYRDEGSVILLSEGYQWRLWHPLASQTSMTIRQRVQEYRKVSFCASSLASLLLTVLVDRSIYQRHDH